MVNKELLDFLVCPVCRSAVKEDKEGIRCSSCCKIYPVRGNIPVMLQGEAGPSDQKDTVGGV